MYEEDVNVNETCLYERLRVTNIIKQKKCNVVVFRDEETNKKVKETFGKTMFRFQNFKIGEVYGYLYTGSFYDDDNNRVDTFSIRNFGKNFNLYFTEDGRQIILGWGM